MDKKDVYSSLAKIYAEEMLRTHNEILFSVENKYESYERSIDLLLNYYEEAVNGFEAIETNKNEETEKR